MNQIQKELLSMLIDVDTIARKYKIDYSLSGGTAIGAVRHGGFIPWDDDADIELRRDNFQKLLPILEEELDKKYAVVWDKTFPKTKDAFAQVINTSIKVERHFYNHKSIPNGLPLDIFSYNMSKYKKKKFFHRLWMNINFMKNGRSHKDKVFNIFSNFFKLFPQMIINKGIRKQINKEGSGNFWSLHFFKEKDNIDINIDDHYEDILFEQSNFQIHRNIDEYLKKRYGNYMELPKVEDRETHDIKILS